jgi:mono/diheme cytochrome c family protein
VAARSPATFATKALVLGPIAALLALVIGAGACNSADGEVREWLPEDHQGEQRGNGQVPGSTAGDQDATLIEVTWRQNCAVCHGMRGRGDTQQGQMLRVPDLGRGELRQIADEVLATTIKRGRNKMPAFEKLPDKVVEGLVRHLRSFSAPER